MRGVVRPRFVSVVLVSALLAVPFFVAARAAASLVAPWGTRVAGTLSRLVAPLQTPDVAPAEPDVAEVAQPVEAELSFEVATKPKGRGAVKAPAKSKPSALFVSQATVLKLAQTSARPRGAFVPQTSEHPAGLRLSGVAALGIGLQDGDILTEALGITPRGPGEIIGAIIEARAQHARFLSGTAWRHGESFRITVEQPYLPAEPPS